MIIIGLGTAKDTSRLNFNRPCVFYLLSSLYSLKMDILDKMIKGLDMQGYQQAQLHISWPIITLSKDPREAEKTKRKKGTFLHYGFILPFIFLIHTKMFKTEHKPLY